MEIKEGEGRVWGNGNLERGIARKSQLGAGDCREGRAERKGLHKNNMWPLGEA